jgi:AraC-like DNA-binding protein
MPCAACSAPGDVCADGAAGTRLVSAAGWSKLDNVVTPTRRAARRRGPVTPVGYRPPGGYALDIEVLPLSELRRRAGDVVQRGFERIDFHCLMLVTAGRYVHLVDFTALACAPGTLVVLQPGQVHHFGDLSDCEGWMLLFRSELLDPRGGAGGTLGGFEAMQQLEALPGRLQLGAAARPAVEEGFARIASDAGGAPTRSLNALLRSQVEALLIRLHLDQGAAAAGDAVEPAPLRRFRRFRALLEREFARWHGLAPYARALACSEKSLDRAVRAVSDRSAKAMVTERIVLEAKRLLVHSLLPVANIGYELGFTEPTNFAKFFRRETRLTPGAFRAQMLRGTATGATPRG